MKGELSFRVQPQNVFNRECSGIAQPLKLFPSILAAYHSHPRQCEFGADLTTILGIKKWNDKVIPSGNKMSVILDLSDDDFKISSSENKAELVKERETLGRANAEINSELEVLANKIDELKNKQKTIQKQAMLLDKRIKALSMAQPTRCLDFDD